MVSKSYNRKYQNVKSQNQKKSRSEARRGFSRFVSRAADIIKVEKSAEICVKQKRLHSVIRGLAVIWLAEKLNVQSKECRFSSLSHTKCRKAVRLCADSRPRELADWIIQKLQSHAFDANSEPCGGKVTLIIVRKECAVPQGVGHE